MTTHRRFAIVRHEMSAESAPQTPELEGASWDLLRMLLLVAEHGSIRQAAFHARIDHATVRTRLDQLETLLGTTLIARPFANQIELTDAGRRLVPVAQQMRRLAEGTKRADRFEGFDAQRFVPLAISEGIGAFWLLPQLTRLMADNTSVALAVSTVSHSFQGAPSENEIVIQLDRPLAGNDLHAERIATLHVIPAAAPNYIAKYGRPSSIDDLPDHRFVWQDGDITERASLGAMIDLAFLRTRTAFLAESSLAHYTAVADGCGIGLLPTYAHAIGPRQLEWLDLAGRIRRDVYLIAHPEVRHSARHAQVIDWIRRAFDPVRYPWFRETYVDPADFPSDKMRDARNVVTPGHH